jgi:hypothetical protein
MGEGREDAPDRAQAGHMDEAELRCAGMRMTLRGRALSLILWLASHQTRINESAPECGQIWLTWKGNGPKSITGDIRTKL